MTDQKPSYDELVELAGSLKAENAELKEQLRVMNRQTESGKKPPEQKKKPGRKPGH